MTVQYTETDLAQAILDHERGYLTTTGLVVYYFRIKKNLANDFNPKEICNELNISEISLYRALSTLIEDSIQEDSIHQNKEI